MRRLRANGFEAHICGGYVRDMLLGRDLSKTDKDIATNAGPGELMELFRDARPTLAGDSFPVVYVGLIEVATYRGKVDFHTSGVGPRGRVEPGVSLHDDLGRRDLTINAMAYDPQRGRVIDPFGGRDDLARGLIRFVRNPDARILEDPNRILRACRFLALTQGSFDPASFTALRRHGSLLARINPDSGKPLVPPERIGHEIRKAMKIPKASAFFRALHDIGVLDMVLPSLEACYDHPHGEHHYEDIFSHAMLCGDAISPRFPILKLAGYLHDVGKPASHEIDAEGNIANFIGHARKGAALLAGELEALRFSQAEIARITGLTLDHMKPLNIVKPKNIRKLATKWSDAGLTPEDFIRLGIADRKANLKWPDYTLGDIRNLFVKPIRAALDDNPPLRVKDLALSGRELIEAFRLTPGPIVGWLQRELLEHVLEDPARNKPGLLLELGRELLSGKQD